MRGRLTPAARALLDAAEREARMLGHDVMGSEHLLLALTSTDVVDRLDVDRDGLRTALAHAAEDAYGFRGALATIGIDLDEVNERAQELFGPSALRRNGTRPRRAPSVEHTLAAARREARSAGMRRAGPEHVLLGALSSGAPGADVLLAHGVTASELRRADG